MSLENIRKKRFCNEDNQDELVLLKRDTERKQEAVQELMYHENRFNEELLKDFLGSSSGYEFEDLAEADRQSESKFMHFFEEFKEEFHKKQLQLEDENEELYQEEIKLLKEKEGKDGKS